jgi:hypothetical protein
MTKKTLDVLIPQFGWEAFCRSQGRPSAPVDATPSTVAPASSVAPLPGEAQEPCDVEPTLGPEQSEPVTPQVETAAPATRPTLKKKKRR